MNFRVLFRDNGVGARLRTVGMKTSADELKKLFAVVGVASVKRNFEAGGRPKWRPLSALTKKWRRGGSSIPLNDTGTLRGGIHFVDLGGNRAAIATGDQSTAYAAFQHFGGRTPAAGSMTRRQIWFFKSRGVGISLSRILRGFTIPGRPYLKLQREDVEELERAAMGQALR